MGGGNKLIEFGLCSLDIVQLVAERICRFADIVGRERVIAGTDCGFSTFAGFGAVDEDIVYAKLQSMTDGAAIASVQSRLRTAPRVDTDRPRWYQGAALRGPLGRAAAEALDFSKQSSARAPPRGLEDPPDSTPSGALRDAEGDQARCIP